MDWKGGRPKCTKAKLGKGSTAKKKPAELKHVPTPGEIERLPKEKDFAQSGV